MASAPQTLDQLAQRKARLEEELAEVERQVYNLETSYLNDSSAHGNVLRGFEGFLGAAKVQKCVRATVAAAALALTPPPRTNRSRNFKTEERLFSLSSVSSPAVRSPPRPPA